MTPAEEAALVKVYPNRVWIEYPITGDAAVFLQSEAPESEPVRLVTIHYAYPWIDNSTRNVLAEDIARKFGATGPVESRYVRFFGEQP